jgi:xylose isomerase
MYEVLKAGGLAPGGLNFDAKVRRESFEPVDLFHSHVAGMDAFARGLEVANELLDSGALESLLTERYASYDEGIGEDIVEGRTDLESLASYALEQDAPAVRSGGQERLEMLLNRYILET